MLKVLAIFIYVSHKHTIFWKSAWRVALFSLLLLKIYDPIYRFFLNSSDILYLFNLLCIHNWKWAQDKKSILKLLIL